MTDQLSLSQDVASRVIAIFEEFAATSQTHNFSEFEDLVMAEFPQLTLAELQDVKKLIHWKCEYDALLSKHMAELTLEAQRLSGKPDMALGEALEYLAGQGHTEASDLLRKLVTPEFVEDCEDIETAAKLHPDWEVSESAVMRCLDPQTPQNTLDKLLAWYRKRH